MRELPISASYDYFVYRWVHWSLAANASRRSFSALSSCGGGECRVIGGMRGSKLVIFSDCPTLNFYAAFGGIPRKQYVHPRKSPKVPKVPVVDGFLNHC